MLRPVVGVSISASRTALSEDLEGEARSSRIVLKPPEVLVVLEEESNVAKLSTKFVTVEGKAHGITTAGTTGQGLVQTQQQFADGLASTIFHKLRSGDEVLTVSHGPSGCGKSTSLFGTSIDPTARRSGPVPSNGMGGGGLFWDVATRVFSLAGVAATGGGAAARSLSSSASDPNGAPSGGALTTVEVAVGCIEYRATTGSSDDGDEAFLREEAVDLIKDVSDCTTPCGCFAASFADVPLSQYVVCRDATELQTVMLVALSRSQSWVPDTGMHTAVSEDDDDASRLEMPQRPVPDGAGHGTGPQPLVPAVGGRSHLNVNLLIRVVHPLEGADAASAERRNRALNVADGEPMPSLVTSRTTCSVWRLFDLMGAQLYDFEANPIAEMSARSQRALLQFAMAPLVPSVTTVVAATAAGGQSRSGSNAQHVDSVLPPPPSLFDPHHGSLCVEVIASLLRGGTSHIVWVCALRQDYAFDHLNAEGLRVAAWVADRCGRPVALDERRRNVRDKHLHVARKVMQCHALPASVFFLEVMDLRRTTAGARYASLAHQLALNTAVNPSRRLQSAGGGEWPHAAVSPQSISLDNYATTHGDASVSEGEGFWTSARSTSNDTLTSSFHQHKHHAQVAGASCRRSTSSAAGADVVVGEGSSVGGRPSSDNGARRGVPSFALEAAPEARQLPNAQPHNAQDRVPVEAHAATLPGVDLQSVVGDADNAGNAANHVPQYNAAAMAASAAVRSHRPAGGTQSAHGTAQQPEWDSVLRQFRNELSAAPPLPEEAASAKERHLSRPSRGGTVPRHHHHRRSVSDGAHPVHTQESFGAVYPQPLASETSPTNARHPISSSSRGSSSHNDHNQQYPRSVDSSSQPDGPASMERADIVEALQAEVIRLQAQVETLRAQAPQQPQVSGGDAAIASLLQKMVQPVLARLEEESAALRAKLLSGALEEREIGPGATDTSIESDGDLGAAGGSSSTYVDDPLRPTQSAMRQQVPLNASAKQSIHRQYAERRAGATRAAAAPPVGAHHRERYGNRGNVTDHSASQGTISVDVHNAMELQRRVRFLERQLAEAQQHNLNVRREAMDAAQQTISAHKDAFSKILNESGTMYARLQKAHQESSVLHRDTALRLQRVSEEQLVLEEKLTVSRGIEADLRRSVAQLQGEKRQLMRQDALQQAVTSVASVFANASQSDNGSAASVLHASSSSNPHNNNATTSDGRRLFDASLMGPPMAAPLSTSHNNVSSGSLNASRWSGGPSAHSTGRMDSNTAAAVGFLSFQQAVHNLLHAATAPFATMEGVLQRTTDALQRVQALRSDPVANQCFKELQLAVRDMEHKRLQATLHASLVKEELTKLDAQWRELHQRERQYLNVLVSR